MVFNATYSFPAFLERATGILPLCYPAIPIPPKEASKIFKPSPLTADCLIALFENTFLCTLLPASTDRFLIPLVQATTFGNEERNRVKDLYLGTVPLDRSMFCFCKTMMFYKDIKRENMYEGCSSLIES
jgi:hypothetical protein